MWTEGGKRGVELLSLQDKPTEEVLYGKKQTRDLENMLYAEGSAKV